MNAGLKTVSAQMPLELAERLERLAAANERSVSAELRIAVRDHVDDHQEIVVEEAA